MICPKCGTKIPRKALVCYNCQFILAPFELVPGKYRCGWCGRHFDYWASDFVLTNRCPYCRMKQGIPSP